MTILTTGISSGDRLYDTFVRLDFPKNTLSAQFASLFGRQCCESKMPMEEWSDYVDAVRVTGIGRYHVTTLMKKFNYVDAVVVDTPILE